MVRLSRMLAAPVALLAAAAGVVLPATPAAAVPGRVVVTATSLSNSLSPKGVTASCPAGTVALGGGAKITGGAHHVRIVRSSPLLGADWVASAWEDSYGYAGDWSVTAWLICAPAPPGYQIVTVTTTSDPGTPLAFAAAPCPAGKKVIGAGGNAFNGSSVLELLAPNLSLTSVNVQAAPDEATYPPAGQLAVSATNWSRSTVPGDRHRTPHSPPRVRRRRSCTGWGSASAPAWCRGTRPSWSACTRPGRV
jgi:hypothetical protein